MNAGVTSERIYDALKLRLLSGSIAPGTRLEPAAFAEILGSSVTPVRDALHRLVSEHIVEMRQTEGFQLPIVTEVALRNLLAWNADMLNMALRHWPRGSTHRWPAPELAGDNYASGIRSMFKTIASRSDNAEYDRYIEAASDRLTPARVAECGVLDGPDDELVTLAAAIADGEVKPIARHIASYHRHRVQLVPAIVGAMYRPV